MSKLKILLLPVALIFAANLCSSAQVQLSEVASPADDKVNRERGNQMLQDIKNVLKERYYDKNFHGIDIEKRFKAASDQIKTMDTNSQIFTEIAQLLLEFDDSHTYFLPPGRANSVEYGFTMQMIGDVCFVTDVKKGSDAEIKGLKPGDQIKSIGRFVPTVDSLWKLTYLIYTLDPQASLTLHLAGPNNTDRMLEVKAKFKSIEDRKKEADAVRNKKRENPYKCQAVDADLVACRLDSFSVDKKDIDKMMSEASRYKKLVLDLRGNRGGYVSIEGYLLGHFFDHPVKIADFIARDKKTESIAKVQEERAFKGELVILVDSDSASASEIFARVIQIQKRGRIVGDVSAGAVMTSNYIPITEIRGLVVLARVSVFALNVTVGDVIMSDGNRLEKVGVIPDRPVGPTSLALSKGWDPVLSLAAGLLGVKLTPEEAGKFNFIYKKYENEAVDESDTDN